MNFWKRLSSRSPAAPTGTAPGRREDRPPTGVLGWAGSAKYTQLQLDDYNPDLQGRNALRVYAKMRKQDPQVRAVQSVLSLVVRATPFHVAPPPRAGAAEREAAELLEADLKTGMRSSFDDLLRELLLAVFYGFRVPEIEWEERDGRVAVAEVHSRNPELIESWLYDQGGGLAGYVYAGNRPVGDGGRETGDGPVRSPVPGPPSFRYDRVAIPLDRTLHAVHDRENGSPVGFGVARSMYTPYYFKQAALKVLGIGIERNLLGIPVATAGEGANWDHREEILVQLRRLRACEDAALSLPAGWLLTFFESSRSPVDAQPFLQYCDAAMARSALCQFLNLGESARGTQSLATVHVELFLRQEEALARWVDATVTGQLIRRWCRLNYPAGTGPRSPVSRPPGIRCPQLVHQKIQSTGLSGIATALNTLVDGGFVHPTEQDEEYLRQVAELPPLPA